MIHRSTIAVAIGAACLSLFGGCAYEASWVAPNFHAIAPQSVAIMPPANVTPILAGGTLLQYLAGQTLPQHGFYVRDVNQTNDFLAQQGITDGGRLGQWTEGRWMFAARPSPQQLCKDLQVDGLLVGIVETYDYLEAVYARKRQVEVKWMLVTADGTPVWHNYGLGLTMDGESKSKDAVKSAAANVAIKALEDAQGIPLYPEAVQATQNCFRTLPRR